MELIFESFKITKNIKYGIKSSVAETSLNYINFQLIHFKKFEFEFTLTYIS
jgi:hypothetical protein